VETGAAVESPTEEALIDEINVTLLSLTVSTAATVTVRCSGLLSTGISFMSGAAAGRALTGKFDLDFGAGLLSPPPPPVDSGSPGKIVTCMASP
jgi:hypothetical protein